MARKLNPPSSTRSPGQRLAKAQVRTSRLQTSGGLPTKDQILEFITNSADEIGKREIARAFGIKGADRIELKRLLKELADEGLLTSPKKRIRRRGEIASVAVIDIVGRDRDGELLGEPVSWDRAGDGEPPRVLLVADRRARGEALTFGLGDRVLAEIEPIGAGEREDGVEYSARPIRKLAKERKRLVGIFEANAGGGGRIRPIEKKALKDWQVQRGEEAGAETGELVRYDIERRGRMMLPQAKIVERLGNPADQRLTSLIAIASFDIPNDFPRAVDDELATLSRLTMGHRSDLRSIPLITIDPADARDHDDAVFAEADAAANNDGGHIVLVAIADVATYVRPGTALDREAEKRGNSVYFPDRVVPMLPEEISNGVCSLKEAEDRPCLAVRMVFDRHGRKLRHEFMRGMMRSAAKLSYQDAQAAIDGRPSDKTGPLLDPILKPLWAAYRTLAKARHQRQPLDLDLPERKILVGTDGRVSRIDVPARLEAHRLIEEFMIAANVAAAESLEQKSSPLVYRVHAEPGKEKLQGLRVFLETLDLSLPKGGQLRPEHFNAILAKTRSSDVADLVNEVVLRSQSQAEYTKDNIGHFGLNLGRYAHFTSPIRRYADLIVHRALIRAFGLGDDGLGDRDIERLSTVARHISETERRAMLAERETADRLIAQFLADRIGADFKGRISGVTKSGLFVRLDDTGADGFIPISTLGREYFRFDEALHALIGERSGAAYRLGDRCDVRLVEAIPTAGALRFEMLSEGGTGAIEQARKPILRRGHRGRPAPHRRRR